MAARPGSPDRLGPDRRHRLASRPAPRPRCCETTAAATRAASRRSGPAFVTSIAEADVVRRQPWRRSRRPPSSGRRRRPPVSSSSYSGWSWPAAGVLGHEVVVRERPLGVVVAPAQPRVGRRRVEVPVALLDVLAVVALEAGQAERPLLQDRVGAVPEGEPEAEPLVAVADGGQAVLVPAVGPRAGVVVRERRPGLAVGRVVLPDRPPGPRRDERSPPPPRPPVSARRSRSGSLTRLSLPLAGGAWRLPGPRGDLDRLRDLLRDVVLATRLALGVARVGQPLEGHAGTCCTEVGPCSTSSSRRRWAPRKDR